MHWAFFLSLLPDLEWHRDTREGKKVRPDAVLLSSFFHLFLSICPLLSLSLSLTDVALSEFLLSERVREREKKSNPDSWRRFANFVEESSSLGVVGEMANVSFFPRNLEHGPHLFCLSSLFCPLAFAWQMSYFLGERKQTYWKCQSAQKRRKKGIFLP